MKIINECDYGGKTYFDVSETISDIVLEQTKVDIQPIILTSNNSIDTYMLYDTNREPIKEVYNYLNHNFPYGSSNTKKSTLYEIKYLYAYKEIINKELKDFKHEDFVGLSHFLRGVSANTKDIIFNLKTKRSGQSVNKYFSTYRKFFRHLELYLSPILTTRDFAKYSVVRSGRASKLQQEVPKYISADEFLEIIDFIHNDNTSEERKLRNECICRIMYEGGLRLGEVLGLTFEDLEIHETYDNEICYVYIRNRLSDEHFQCAKTCMNISSKKEYISNAYNTETVGFQKSFLPMDTYDLICKYTDLAHDRAYKVNTETYERLRADSVASYKKQGKANYYLFISSHNKPLSDEAFNVDLRRIFRACKIHVDSNEKRYNLAHRFRHGFIMHLLYDLKYKREIVQLRARHRAYSSLDAYYNPTTEQIIKDSEFIQKGIKEEIEGE